VIENSKIDPATPPLFSLSASLSLFVHPTPVHPTTAFQIYRSWWAGLPEN